MVIATRFLYIYLFCIFDFCVFVFVSRFLTFGLKFITIRSWILFSPFDPNVVVDSTEGICFCICIWK